MAIAYPTSKDYDQVIAQGFWIADFYTSTCGPCKLIDRMVNEIVTDNPDINWAKDVYKRQGGILSDPGV